MKSLTIAVAVTGAVFGFGSAAQAQGAGPKLFFECDMVQAPGKDRVALPRSRRERQVT